MTNLLIYNICMNINILFISEYFPQRGFPTINIYYDIYKVINNYKICLSYYAYLKFSNKKFRLWRPIPESEPGHYVKLCLRYAYFLPKNEARYAYKQYAYKKKHVCVNSFNPQL